MTFPYFREFDFAKKLIKRTYAHLSSKSLSASIKADESIVTNLDVQLEKTLIENIKRKFTLDNFLTEETSNKTNLTDRTWVIDPIDGTAFFTRHSNFFTMQLAFYDKGETQFSIIYDISQKKLYSAIKGLGAYINGKKITNRKQAEYGRCNVCICGSPAKWGEVTASNFEKIYKNARSHYLSPQFLIINSSGYAYTLLANGTIDFLIEAVKTPWDYMPGDLLVKELSASYHFFDNTRYYSFCPELDKFLDLDKAGE